MALIRPDGGIVLSPSDLTAAARCELGWLRRIDVRLGRIDAIADDDPLLERIARLGDAHEARELRLLQETREVVEIPRPAPYTVEGLQLAAQHTHAALLDGVEAVAQAVLFDGEFGGMADFLVRGDDGRYQVWDAKLARRARVEALLQIAAYADQLDRLGVPRAADGYLLLGDRTRHAQHLDEIIPVFRRRRDYLRAVLRDHLAGPEPARWGDDRYAVCGQCAVCEAGIAESDDLLAVAGLSGAQRTAFRAAGVLTTTQLAATTSTVDGVTDRTWQTLRAQAALQSGTTDGVEFEVFDGAHLNLLPAPDPGDIFFDFEGDPMWTDSDGVAAGLEYLFGLVELDGTDTCFTPFWAHSRAEEKRALIDFFEHVARRRADHPGLHIYHYAPYEPAALKRLTVRHGYGEDQLDDLLRDGVFVDLYAAVRRSIRVSAPSYSIKKLEPLYMGDQLRDADGVTTAGDSILQYHEFQAARERGDAAAAQALLDAIADYNEYDCVSTWKLRDWLLAHRTREVVTRALDESTQRGPSKLAELQGVADELLELVPDERSARDHEQQGIALLAAALGYFRREDKPMWWAYFDRAVSPVDEWVDQRDTVLAEHVEVTGEWAKATPRARTFTRVLRMSGIVDDGTTLAPGTEMCAVYEDIPPGVEVAPGAHRAFTKNVTVLGISSDDAGSAVEFSERTTTGQATFDELPMAIFKYTFIDTAVLETAIGELASDVLHRGELPANPVCDILALRPPRLVTGCFDGSTDAGAMSIDDLVASVRALDGSYLAVQGPPGAGKTYLGSNVVAALVAGGWKVGVVAQGHATVEQFLGKVVEAGVDADRVGKMPRRGSTETPIWVTPKDKNELAEFLDADGGRVIGGTAWNLAALPPESLDLLVIDEAGQFSLAHTIAAARPARRLLLLGDPQQLPQVSQGSHPEPVNASALGWLAAGHDTLPPERGYFLAKTWRMHSELTAPVSALAYDGRLHSQADVTDARALDGVRPGLHPVAVEHTGNTVVSGEEAAAVVEIVRDLIGARWRDDDSRALSAADVIIVAAYNAQVAAIRRALDDAGYGAAMVGTVDKIQGREAPVAIVSLAASSAADLQRGLEFLLDRRRLNVAISRAQWATYLVHSPALGDALPTSVDGLMQLGSFLRLIDS